MSPRSARKARQGGQRISRLVSLTEKVGASNRCERGRRARTTRSASFLPIFCVQLCPSDALSSLLTHRTQYAIVVGILFGIAFAWIVFLAVRSRTRSRSRLLHDGRGGCGSVLWMVRQSLRLRRRSKLTSDSCFLKQGPSTPLLWRTEKCL